MEPVNEVSLSTGQKVSRKEVVKVKDIANAGKLCRGDQYLLPYAIMSQKIDIDGKPAVFEDVMEMTEDDFLLITSLFAEDDPKNA
ncbi:MAG: hypothetical protein Q8909_16830 [Bacteroidota bacterium]|nr:hypothetical protein [Bacteroidota bacterium]